MYHCGYIVWNNCKLGSKSTPDSYFISNSSRIYSPSGRGQRSHIIKRYYWIVMNHSNFLEYTYWLPKGNPFDHLTIVFYNKPKHVEICLNVIRDMIESKKIAMEKIVLEDNQTNIFIKSLSKSSFKYCLDLINFVE